MTESTTPFNPPTTAPTVLGIRYDWLVIAASAWLVIGLYAEHATLDLIVGQIQVDDTIDVIALQKELGLTGIAGEPIDNETEVPVVGGETVPDDGLDQVVVDQMASGHDPFDLSTQLRVVLDIPAEDVTDTDVFEVEVFSQQLGLGPLAASLDPHDDELPHAGLYFFGGNLRA